MYMCTDIYVYIHIYTHTYIHIKIHCIYEYIYTHICMFIYIHIHIHIVIYIYIYVSMSMYIHIFLFVQTCTYKYTYIYAYIFTNLYMFVFSYTEIYKWYKYIWVCASIFKHSLKIARSPWITHWCTCKILTHLIDCLQTLLYTHINVYTIKSVRMLIYFGSCLFLSDFLSFSFPPSFCLSL